MSDAPAATQSGAVGERASGLRRASLLALRAMGVLMLVAQVAWIVLARFDAESLVFVTPWAGQTSYHLHASREGVALGGDELRARYGIALRGRTDLTAAGLKVLLQQREELARDSRGLTVRLHVIENGGNEEVWLWPQW